MQRIRTPLAVILGIGLVVPASAFNKSTTPPPAPGQQQYAPAMQPRTAAAPAAQQQASPQAAAQTAAPQAAAPQAAPAAGQQTEAAPAQEQQDSQIQEQPKRRLFRRKKAPRRKVVRRTAAQMRATMQIAQGMKEMEAKDYSAAAALFNRAARSDPRSVEAAFFLGQAYYQRAFTRNSAGQPDRNDAENAIEAYETALDLDPEGKVLKDSFLLYHGLAQCYEAVEQYPEALNALKQASRIAPRNPMPALYSAKIRYKMRDWDSSSANFYYSVRRARKTRMLPQLAKLVKTDPGFQNLLTVPQNKVILDSFEAVDAGMLSEAEAKERIRGTDNYRDSLRDVPVNPRPQAVAAMPMQDPEILRLIDAGHMSFHAQTYRDAITSYQAALSADAKKNTLDAVQKSLVYERMGASYRQLGLSGEALRVLERSVAELPQNSSAYYEMALCYATAGQMGTSLTYLNKALENSTSQAQLKRTLMMAKTDTELSAARDTDRYQEIISAHSAKVQY